MRVIIIGAGEVGLYLAQILIEEKHDVCIVEQDEHTAHELDQSLDASVIHGTGVSREVLFRAGITQTDLLLAITKVDEVNLVAAMTAERIRPECRTVARVRDPRYIHGTDAIRAGEYGVDFLVGPEQVVADQVVDLLQYGGPGHISTVADGRVVMLEVPVVPHSPLAYATAEEFQGASPEGTLIVARSGPKGLMLSAGTDRFELGERIFVVLPRERISDFLSLASSDSRKVRRVLLIGGGDIGFHVARHLRSLHLDVTLMERDTGRAERLAVRLPKVNVINADATDPPSLEQQMESGQDAVVVLLSDDEKSLWVALVAKGLGATKVIALAGKRAYAPLAYRHGLDAIISPRRAMADAILRFARRGSVVSTTMLGDHEGELIEFLVGKTPGHGLTKTPVKELKLPADSLVALLVRGETILFPDHQTVIQPGDHVLMVALRDAVAKLDKLFS